MPIATISGARIKLSVTHIHPSQTQFLEGIRTDVLRSSAQSLEVIVTGDLRQSEIGQFDVPVRVYVITSEGYIQYKQWGRESHLREYFQA